MTNSVIVWICLIFFAYILRPGYTDGTKTSKACYGVPGPSCTRHVISCSSTQKIAICDAYYTDNTECGFTGISSCSTVNPDNVTEHGHHRFNNTELVPLYNNCSTENQCVYPAPVRRSAAFAFSVVKYQCIKKGELLNTSGGVAEGLSQVALIHREQRTPTSTIETINYMCSFKSDVTATSISVYALDARLTPGQCLSKLSVLPQNEITMNNCSSVLQPFKRLNVTAELPISLNFVDFPRSSSALIWLLINASDPFNVTCQAVTGAGGLTTGSTEYSSTISPSSQFPVRLTTKSTGDESIIPTSSQFPVGLFVGGMAVGAVIVILVGLAVYVLVVRRRYDLTPKKQGDIPACIEHPTYSGLSAGGDVNNYDIIEQTSGFQGDTTHEVAATPDYQNL